MSKGDPYASGMQKLTEAGYNFNRPRDGVWLKAFENTHIEQQVFREQLKIGLGCKLSLKELDALMPHFDNDGYVNGSAFLLLFTRIRSELRDKAQQEQIANKQRARAIDAAFNMSVEVEEPAAPADSEPVDFDYSPAEKKTAISKLTDAAANYDKNMPGAVQLQAFEGASLTPGEFKHNLKQCFGLKISPQELGALMDHFDRNGDGFITCQEFLVSFFRLGFDERSRRIKLLRDRRKKEEEMARKIEQKRAEDQERENATKVSFEYSEKDKAHAMEKLRLAAKLYDRTAPGAPSLTAFDRSEMPPYIFKEQLKSTFKLTLTKHEMGAVMDYFDVDGNGKVSCQEFTKIFLGMGFQEREREAKAQRAKQKALIEEAEAKRREAEKEKERKLQLQTASGFTDEDFQTALGKLTEAAFKYSKNAPGAPNLSAFESKSMPPHIFKEQLKRAFGIKATPPELAALMKIFDTEGTGMIDCADFIVKFVKVGTDERMRRKEAWRKHQKEANQRRLQQEMEKQVRKEMQSNLKVKYDFTDDEYASAMSKLTEAAVHFNKGGPGSVGLNAFEGQSMPPHVFKEQLKLVFSMRVTPGELGALMRIFDKDGDGVVNCQEFLMKFFKVGQDEKTRIFRAVAEQKKIYMENLEEKARREKEEKEAMAMAEADFDFLEEEFDAALSKFVQLAMVADARTLGPAGLKTFETASLTPKEFREALKRTFGVRVTAPELGALVTLFDTSLGGTVSTHSFISTLVLVRAKLGPHKGRFDEKEMCSKQHALLKDEYTRRIQRQILGDSEGKKPWQQIKPNKDRKKGTSTKGYPKTPLSKLARRLAEGKKSGRLDLSSKQVWDSDKAKHRTQLMTEHLAQNPEANVALRTAGQSGSSAAAKDKAKSLEDMQTAIHSFSFDHVGTIEWPNASEHQDELMRMETHIDRLAIEMRLQTIPQDVFFMPNLRELWLDNNAIQILPPEVSALKQLRLLSMEKNGMKTLPDEICELTELRRISFHRNQLSSLPENFHRLSKLIDIDLSDNAFVELPEILLSLKSLEQLYLARNKITTLPMGLKGLRSLTALSLEKNPIEPTSPILADLPWVRVRIDTPLPTVARAPLPLTISHEEDKYFTKFLKDRSEARASRKVSLIE